VNLPNDNGARPSTYLFTVLCFYVGVAFLTAISFGRIRVDDRDGPGFNPFTRMPDGKIGVSEFGTSTIGFVVLGLLLGVGLAVAYAVRYIQLH
jgi:hypothetical protein